MKTYPICLTGLESQHVVVIGGGKVAARKVAGLVDAGARTTVISPTLCPELENWVSLGIISWQSRPYRQGDLAGCTLAIAATGDPEANQAVWREAGERGCLVNVVDDPQHSSFILPAVTRRGELVVAVSTGGASPALAWRLRERFDAEIGPEYGELVDLLAELRPSLAASSAAGAERRDLALRLIDSGLLEILQAEGRAAAEEHALQILAGEGG